MSKASEFLELADRDEEVREKMGRLTQEETVAFAAKLGYTFTLEELQTAAVENLNEKILAGTKKGELTDEEVSQVVGGSGLAEFCEAYPTTAGCLFLRPVRRQDPNR